MMISKRFLSIILLTGLGFLGAISVGLLVFVKFQEMTHDYSEINRRFYKEYIEYLKMTTLANMAEYIEINYPVLKDPAKLEQEAGTDWFWDLSEDLNNIKSIFDFAYIYYVKKTDNDYLFLLSSGIQRNEHPEWLGGSVWSGAPPDYIIEAQETRKLSFSAEPIINEWGENISAALPIISNGEVVGILGIDYDVSFIDDLMQDEMFLERNERNLLKEMRNILIVSIIVIIVFMTYQIWVSTTSAMVSLKDVESDKRTRIMLEATPMMCALWDINAKILDCDEETARIYGLKNKKDYIEHFYDLNPVYQPDGESTRTAVIRIGSEARETGYKRFEWMTRTALGEEFPVEVTVVRIPWNDEFRFAVYSRDLREDKAKEAALQESENRLRVMLDTMTFSCYFFNPDGKLVDCNQSAIDLFGCKNKEELIEKFIYLSPEYQSDGSNSIKKSKEIILNTFETGEINTIIWDHIKTDGTHLPVEITLIRVKWKDSYRVVSFTTDLSQIVETEDNLRRVLAIAEASPNLTVFLGSDGNIEYMNPAVFHSTGFSKEELYRDRLKLIFHPEDYQRLNDEYIAAVHREETINFEITLVKKNGDIRDYNFSAFSVQLHNRRTGIGLIGRDITEQKQIQRDLIVAKEQAEKALASEVQYNRAKGDFLSRVSHELRTPLNAILGITNIAEKDSAKKRRELDQYITKIKISTEHLLSLVNDILDMTGFDTGKFDFVLKPFSFSDAMHSVIHKIEQKIKAKEQIFVPNIDSGIHDYLLSDERRIKQVLLNLLNNAVKFTPEKGRIDFSARSLEKNENECTIRFEVIDNGIGMSPELQKNIGETFEQEDNSITRKYGGMGLNLSLTKRIVEMMNGRISVKSDVGQGSCFICDIRVGIAKAAEKDISETFEDFSSIIDLTGRRVLVVDDIEMNRDILFAMLEETGAILDGACNGEDAIKMFSREKYDLVLMDLHMPVMDGFTAVKNIRTSTQPWAASVPIISISAESSVELHWKCLEAGINEHLAKPVVMEALFGIISKWVSKKPAA